MAGFAFTTVKINIRTPNTITKNIIARSLKLSLIEVFGFTYKDNSEVTETSQLILPTNVLIEQRLNVKPCDSIIANRQTVLNPKVDFKEVFCDITHVDLVINATAKIHKKSQAFNNTLTLII